MKVKLDKIIKPATQAMLKLKNGKNTPKILLAAGVVTVVSSGVYACVQTMKLEDKIDEAKENIDHIKELKEDGEYIVNTETGETADYTPALYRKDMAYAWTSGVWSIAKLYLPSLIGTGIGITMIGGSHKIMADRLAQTTLALTAMSEAYDKYRRNVIREYGPEVDERMRLGLETKKNLEMDVIDPETGELISKKEKKLDVISDVGNIASDYAIILNDCAFWIKDSNYNKICIDARLTNLQNILNRDHYIYFYQILKEFDILDKVSTKTIAMAHQTGIIEGFGDGCLNAKVIDTHLGVEDYYKAILLMDFNCIGGAEVDGEYKTFNELVYERRWLDKSL